jgi:hypothetical protein
VASLEIHNLAGLVTGRLGDGRAPVDAIRCDPLRAEAHRRLRRADWTPRQSALGWIESSMHGGVWEGWDDDRR